MSIKDGYDDKKRIWKFNLPVSDEVELMLPCGLEILSIQDQHGQLCIWGVCVPGRGEEKRLFRIFGTGNPVRYRFSYHLVHLATVQSGCCFVWHVFEEKERISS